MDEKTNQGIVTSTVCDMGTRGCLDMGPRYGYIQRDKHPKEMD